MAAIIVSTLDTALGSNITLADQQSLLVLPGAGLFSETFAISADASATNTDITIYGTIDVFAVSAAPDSQITIAETGTLVTDVTLTLRGASFLLNTGQIMGPFLNHAVWLNGSNNAVVNAGKITAYNGVFLGADSGAGGDRLVNSGLISASSAGVSFRSTACSVENSGTITADTYGILCNAYVPGLYTFQVLNSGTITSDTGIRLDGDVFVGSVFTVTNTGTISGQSWGILGGLAQELVRNSGVIHGAIDLGGESDVLDSRGGDIFGDVNLGGGDDIFNILGGQFQGTVTGGTGKDAYYTDDATLTIIETDADADTVNAATSFRLAANVEYLNLLGTADYRGLGNASANQINGNAGDNRLSGFAGHDTMTGDHGHDTLNGGAGNDTMLGGDGDDVMQGGAGNDTARGEDGDDVVNGGAGTDLIAGGAGLDTFVFSAIAHTTNILGTADIISDFVKGEDKVNLSSIDAITTNATPDNAFTFIGTAAFTNVAGQLRYSQAAGYTNVEMDVDGNGTIDGIVRLFGTLTLNAGDFVL